MKDDNPMSKHGHRKHSLSGRTVDVPATRGLVLCSLLFLASSTVGQVVKVEYQFGGNASASPIAVVPSQGRDGKLYGTTIGTGGTHGAIFKDSTIGTAVG